MQFYEKLIFLLNLTQVTNRMLAQELQVDPSLISRFRTGRRRLPRNREHIKAMSAYLPAAAPRNINARRFPRC